MSVNGWQAIRGRYGEITNCPVTVPTPERSGIEHLNRKGTEWIAINFDIYGLDLSHDPLRYAVLQRRQTETGGYGGHWMIKKEYFLVRWYADNRLPPRYWGVSFKIARQGVQRLFAYLREQKRKERFLRHGEALRLRAIRACCQETKDMIPGVRRIGLRVILPNGEELHPMHDIPPGQLKSRLRRCT